MYAKEIFLKFILAFSLFVSFAFVAAAQTVVDKTVATVSDGVRTELITYSDLLWQLALQPGAPLNPARQEDLKEIFQIVSEQRLIALEAERLPSAAPTDAEVKAEISRILQQFPSAAVFEARLRSVGFDSTDDPNFRRIIEQRVAIEKYLDFRFRSFVVITPEEEQRLYTETFVPRFRRLNPGLVVPQLEEARRAITEELTEARIETEINRFLEEARSRATVTNLEPI